MGIYKLMSLLQEKAPDSIRKVSIEAYSGRIVACDASMAMYQFLASVQGHTNNVLTELTDKDGNKTGHLVGLFNRTIQFLENGIKPIWVFDGKPPKRKNGELARRKKIKEEAHEKMQDAAETGDMEEALKQKIRTVSVTTKMKEDAKTMLSLLGMPVIEAPCEAEAQCALLAKSGKVFATASEDMDAITFGTSYLLRGFNSKKEPILEICYDEVIKGLDLTHNEFVDMCILCGCDYSETIEGVGPATAYKLIKEYKNIEAVIKHLEEENKNSTRKKKYVVPSDFYFEDARELFLSPVVEQPSKYEFKWNKPSEEELKKFLIDEKGFSETRVDSGLKKIKSVDTKGYQSHLENFFGKPIVVKNKNNSDNKKQTGKKGAPLGGKKLKTESKKK